MLQNYQDTDKGSEYLNYLSDKMIKIIDKWNWLDRKIGNNSGEIKI